MAGSIPRPVNGRRAFSLPERVPLVYLFERRAAPNRKGRYGRFGSAVARFRQGAFRLGGGGDVHHRFWRILRIHQPVVSRHDRIDRRRNAAVIRRLAIWADPGRRHPRCRPRRLGLVLAWTPLRRRHGADLAVLTLPRTAAAWHRVLWATWRQERVHRPLLRSDPGRHPA